jgi:hypothetical protein
MERAEAVVAELLIAPGYHEQAVGIVWQALVDAVRSEDTRLLVAVERIDNRLLILRTKAARAKELRRPPLASTAGERAIIDLAAAGGGMDELVWVRGVIRVGGTE